MRIFATIALWAYIPIVLGLFAFMRNRRHAVIAAFIIGWEFLPMDRVKLPLLELSKVTACSVGVLMAVCLFDFRRILSFRPKWFDVPMLLWCVCPFVTSMQNNLGAYDGGSSMATQTFLWGIPYFIGRIYFNDFEGLRELCVGVFLGAVVYIPFCLYEMKMSPILHLNLYGHFQHDISQALRWGGWRPMVFMQSGIALGMYMAMACMIGVWLWVCGTVRQPIWGLPFGAWVVILVIVTVLCKALSALLFMAMGLGVLFWIRSARNALPLYLLLLAAPLYMVVRATQTWDGQNLIDVAKSLVGEERAQSLETRIVAENKLSERAMETQEHDPLYGWGKWSPYLSYAPWRYGHVDKYVDKETGEEREHFSDDAITDGMWIITLGTFGILGLASATVTILLPVVLARKRIPLAAWSHPVAAPATVFAVILVLHMLDNLLNAMLNPIFVLAIGGICALGTRKVPAAVATSLGAPPAMPAGGFVVSPVDFPVIPGLRVP